MITVNRFQQLKNGDKPTSEAEAIDFKNSLTHEKRSQAAYKAVATKRKKYKKWPTRKRVLALTDGAGV